jgi:hypothetical protein
MEAYFRQRKLPWPEVSLFPPMEASVARRKLISANGSFCGPREAYPRRWKLPWSDGSLFLPMEASVARGKLIPADGKLPWSEGSLFPPTEASGARWKLISADGSFWGPMEAYFRRWKLPWPHGSLSRPAEAPFRRGPRISARGSAGGAPARGPACRREAVLAGAVGLRPDREIRGGKAGSTPASGRPHKPDTLVSRLTTGPP